MFLLPATPKINKRATATTTTTHFLKKKRLLTGCSCKCLLSHKAQVNLLVSVSLIFKPGRRKETCRSKRVGQFLSKTTLQSYCAKDICTWHTLTHTHTNKNAAANCMAAVDVLRRQSLRAFNVIARTRRKKKGDIVEGGFSSS